jgi:vacuolar-type H+-ATPase subunit I/STV1
MKPLSYRLQGISHLLVFGVVCSVLSGAFTGVWVGIEILIQGAMYHGSSAESGISGAETILLAAGFAGVLSLPAGFLFGGASFFFRKNWHWLVGGVVCALPIACLVSGLVIDPARKIFWFSSCLVAGLFAGLFNVVCPSWWGRSIHTQGVLFLRK